MSENLHSGHDHRGGSHGLTADANVRWLALALGLISAFMVAEVAAGFVAHSLALLSDAAHMLTDVGALLLALVAIRFARRPAAGLYTYGFKRVEILSAQANGVTLLILAVLIAIEAIRRLVHPPAVSGGLVLIVALAGVAVNLTATWSISHANRTSLNVEGAFQHILTDLFGFVATAVAGAVILSVQWNRADAVASLLVAGLMVRAGVGLVRESARIFLEAAPASIDPSALGAILTTRPGVEEVHDLHVWQITSGTPALSAHVIVEAHYDCHAVQHDLQRLLHDQHHIDHTTLQVEHRADTLLQIEAKPDGIARRPHP
jgi:cobalt-zinc-cadmium efflux system protein